jgi:ribosome biogenesis GTPase
MLPEPITLEQLGWDPAWDEEFADLRAAGFEPGRVAVEDKHHYLVHTASGPVTGIASGKLLHESEVPANLPKVGDWVALSLLPNEPKAVIHQVLPRRTKFSRKVPGRDTEEQVLVANVDVVFLVQALDESFRPRLIERHLIMIHESGSRPVVVLNKADLCADFRQTLEAAESAAAGVPVVIVSAKTGEHIDQLKESIHPGETVVFIGPSGVGKSSLINCLCGEEVQATTEVRAGDSKGRHTTTWRELIALPQGGIVIDTPGMREFQLWLAGQGVHGAFSDFEALAPNCRFRDCSHTHETGCAVKEAVAGGQVPGERYENFLKLQRELAYLDEAQHQRACLDRKRKTKAAQRAFNKIKRRANAQDA